MDQPKAHILRTCSSCPSSRHQRTGDQAWSIPDILRHLIIAIAIVVCDDDIILKEAPGWPIVDLGRYFPTITVCQMPATENPCWLTIIHPYERHSRRRLRIIAGNFTAADPENLSEYNLYAARLLLLSRRYSPLCDILYKRRLA